MELRKRRGASFLFSLFTFHFPLFLTLVLGACAKRSPESTPTLPAAVAPQSETERSKDGLEVVWWVTDDSEGRVGEVLASFLDPPQPTDAALRDRWRTSGLRMVRVPLDQFSALQSSLPPAAQRFRQPIGWATEWLEVFRGRRAPDAPLTIAGSPRLLPHGGRGVVRVIARCWPTPAGPGATGSIRLDLAFQFEPYAGPDASSADPFSEPKFVQEQDRGEALRELSMSAGIEGDCAYLLTCEAPGATWAPRAVETREETGFSPAEDDAPTPAATPKPVGPVIPALVTLGEAILQTEPDETNPRLYKALVAFIIRGKSEFRLLR